MRTLYKDLYAVLGVSKDVDAQQLKRAYRKRAIKTHQDKGKLRNFPGQDQQDPQTFPNWTESRL